MSLLLSSFISDRALEKPFDELMHTVIISSKEHCKNTFVIVVRIFFKLQSIQKAENKNAFKKPTNFPFRLCM